MSINKDDETLSFVENKYIKKKDNIITINSDKILDLLN